MACVMQIANRRWRARKRAALSFPASRPTRWRTSRTDAISASWSVLPERERAQCSASRARPGRRAGYRVAGVALAGIAAEGLEIGSGIASRTIACLEHAWEQGREQLTARTDPGHRRGRDGRLAAAGAGAGGSRAAQAKVVLVGDPEQLQAIEAGAGVPLDR